MVSRVHLTVMGRTDIGVPAVGVPGATRHGRNSACIVLLRHDHWTHIARSVAMERL